MMRPRLFGLLFVALPITALAVAEGCSGSDPSAEPGLDASAQPDTGTGTPDTGTGTPDTGTPDTGTPLDGGADAADAAEASAPVTVEILTTGDAGADDSTSSAINTFYQSKKMQWLLLASDLSSAGIPANATIDALELQPTAIPGRQLDGFRIALASTATTPDAVTAFPRAFYGTASVVYGPVDEPTSRWTLGQWTKFTLATPFTWNGTSNVLVETSFTNTVDAVVGGGLAMRSTGRANDLVRYNIHGSVAYPFTSVNAQSGNAEVPAMRITYH